MESEADTFPGRDPEPADPVLGDDASWLAYPMMTRLGG
jgi:hypothetical protein